MVGGAPVDIETVSDTQIKAHLRGDNLSGDVTVRRGKRSVTLGGGATPPFCAVPKITGVTPTGGNVGVEIKITGSNFDPNATVQLGGGAVQPLGVRGAGTAQCVGQLRRHLGRDHREQQMRQHRRSSPARRSARSM